METRKKAIVFFAELRTVYDFTWENWPKENIEAKFDIFHGRLYEILERESADMLVLSIIGNAGSNEEVNDFDYKGRKYSAWGMSSIVDDYYDAGAKKIVIRENGMFGKSLFKDSVAVLSKIRGFGNWEMIEHKDDRPLTEKVLGYLDELGEAYDVEKVFVIDDEYMGSWSTPALNTSLISTYTGKPVILMIPCAPYLSISSSNPQEVDVNRTSRIYSSKHTVSGATECLDIYLHALSLQEKPKTIKFNKLPEKKTNPTT